MENRIIKYIEGLFDQLGDNAQASEVKEEMIQNLLEKYRDLISQGIPQETAYHMSIAGIGDISELLQMLKTGGVDLKPAFYTAPNEGQQRTNEQNGRYKVPVENIRSLEIRWTSGEVIVCPYDGDEIYFEETAPHSLADDETLRYQIANGALQIRFSPSASSLLKFWRLSKRLQVLLPRSLCQNMENLTINVAAAKVDISEMTAAVCKIDTMSGSVTARNITAEKFDLDNISGSNRLDEIRANNLEITSVSGNISYTGDYANGYVDVVSGKITLSLGVLPTSSKISLVSGSVRMEIPDNDGFTLKHHRVSGGMETDFPMVEIDKKRIYKNGAALIDINTVSGNVSVLRK